MDLWLQYSDSVATAKAKTKYLVYWLKRVIRYAMPNYYGYGKITRIPMKYRNLLLISVRRFFFNTVVKAGFSARSTVDACVGRACHLCENFYLFIYLLLRARMRIVGRSTRYENIWTHPVLHRSVDRPYGCAYHRQKNRNYYFKTPIILVDFIIWLILYFSDLSNFDQIWHILTPNA